MQQERPFDLLNKMLGKQMLVRLKGGMHIRGTLASFDIHMNLVIHEAEEVEEGTAKSKIGTLLLRGGNIIYVSPV